MYIKYKILSLCITLLISFPVYPGLTKPHIINLAKDQYQADNKNWSVAQDERGSMYFGNDIGLLEFDGIEWKLNSLPGMEMVRSVAVLSHHTIFTGGYEEFGRWDRDTSGKLKYTSLSGLFDRIELKNDDFWKIFVTEEYVLFQSFNSIYKYNYEKIEKLPLDMNFLFLSKVRDEFLVQQMVGALYRLNDLQPERLADSELFYQTDVRVILPYGTDQYLIGTATKGVYLYDGVHFTEWNKNLSDIMISRELNCGILTSKDTYYLGTILDGIYEVDKQGTIVNHISSENTLQNNTVLALYEDNLNNIWVALDRGISYIRYIDNMSCFIDSNGHIGAIYDAVIWNDNLYLGTNQGVFYVPVNELNNSMIFRNMKLIEGTQGQVWGLKVTDGKLYCSHNRGIKEIREDRKAYDRFNLLTGVYDLEEIRMKDMDLYVLSSYSSIKLVDKHTGIVYNPVGLEEPVSYAVTDHLDNIWMEHFNKGVYRARLKHDLSGFDDLIRYGGDNDDGLPYRLKLFKVGGRVVMLGDDLFFTYDDIQNAIVPDPLLNECFESIHTIRQIKSIGGNLFWALSDRAVYKFYYDGYEAGILENYDLGVYFSLVHSYENISIVNDSIHIVCLDNGFLVYNSPDGDLQPGPRSLPVPWPETFGVTSVKGEKRFFDTAGFPMIPYTFNSVHFGFSAENMFASDLRIQYKLENMDMDWSDPEKINQVNYARLPKGEYKFMVRTVDNQGNYSLPLSYPFKIQSPWYQSGQAIFLYFGIAGMLFYVFWLLLLRRYRNIHLQKIRLRETRRLRQLAGELQEEVERKSAELLTQTSFIIQKNELILKIKDIIDEFYSKNRTTSTTQFYQKITSQLNNAMDSEDDWKMFLIKFEEKHTHFFKQMKMLYPELTSNDLRLCACLKLNLETKEIASLMNLSIKAVENNRYRLRKKLKLTREQNLNDFFLNL